MYGKRRVVLSDRNIISVKGGKSVFPLGFWYKLDDLYYADLKSGEQLY